MNNKDIGTEFEQDFCKLLASKGYWVHFIVPDSRGAQPFDVVAAKDGKPYAFDCKTCVANTFNINRLEDNQITSFERWMRCGNPEPVVAVKHKDEIYYIGYLELKEKRSIKLEDQRKQFNQSTECHS